MGRKEVETNLSRLRAARREYQLSLSDFANRVGYSRSYLSAVELGHLPETEQIVLAYESALGLERGSLREGKQSVARILHRVGHLSIETKPGPTHEVSLEPGKAVVVSREAVLQAMTSLAEEALQTGIPADEVFLTSFGQGEDWKLPESVQQSWVSLQQALLRAGWTINHLIRLDENVGRSLLMVESMLGLLTAGSRYRATYAAPGSALPPANDYFVIAGFCALLRFDTANPQEQAVVLLKDPLAASSIVENCEILLQNMQPLIETISREDPREFQRHLAETELVPGERVLVRGALSMEDSDPALPEMGWVPATSLGTGMSESDQSAFMRQRYESFLTNVKRHRIRRIRWRFTLVRKLS